MFEFASVIVLDNERSLDLREYCEVFIAYMVSKPYKWYMPTERAKNQHIYLLLFISISFRLQNILTLFDE